MTGERRPLLALGTPEVGERFKQKPTPTPQVSRPSAARQGERLSTQFRALVEAFDNERAQLSDGHVDEVDPELVLVFDLAGSVKDFRNAINWVEGLEFLSEFLDEETEPDDDFHMVSRQDGRTADMVQHSLYLVMSNAEAASQLVHLFEQWQADQSMTFERGLTRFRVAFEQLRAIRRWSAADRVRDTGLIEVWREHIQLVGQSVSSVLVEIELWYRRDAEQRAAAEAHLDEIMFVSPYTPMSGSVRSSGDILTCAAVIHFTGPNRVAAGVRCATPRLLMTLTMRSNPAVLKPRSRPPLPGW